MNINAFRLNQHGLARLFGELEARVMDAIWKLDEPIVHDVVQYLGADTNYKTIMTVMNRLVEKGFLSRRKVSRAYIYEPTMTREALYDELSRQVLDGLLEDFGPLVIAQFVDAVEETDRVRLAELAELVSRKLAADPQDDE